MRSFAPFASVRDQEAIRSAVAFLGSRLEERETIQWAAGLAPGEAVKRQAILQLLEGKAGMSLAEPWHTAWRLIEESWVDQSSEVAEFKEYNKYTVGQRISSGDRSDTLVSAIVNLVTPRLAVQPHSSLALQIHKFHRKPKSYRDLIYAKLTSGEIVDPVFLGMQRLSEAEFILSLTNALDTAVARGLEVAGRIGQANAYQFPRRVYYVRGPKQDQERHEPDRFDRGLAPSVKLLFAAISRLIDVDCTAALPLIERWKQSESPIYLRLWAALSCRPVNAPAPEVSEFILQLDADTFWNLRHYPEFAELRATRFQEFEDVAKMAMIRKIRKGPSRRLWPKTIEAEQVKDAQRYCAVQELKRIQVAGGKLPMQDLNWLRTNVRHFRNLAEMNRIDEGFPGRPRARFIAPEPDGSLDVVAGVDRLKALERALSRSSSTLEGPAERASAWMNQEGNPERVLADMESSPRAAGDFPLLWECFGARHAPARRETMDISQHEQVASRVLGLLESLPDDTLSKAIEGIAHWLGSWQRPVVATPNWSVIWLRAWPPAVNSTNSQQPPHEEPDLNVRVSSNADQPQDLDTLNTPAGKLIGVFLAACPNRSTNSRPFAVPGGLRRVRDHAVSAPGRSGLIAKHRFIECIDYFLHSDEDWTRKTLIDPLRADNAEALVLWRAVGLRTQFQAVLEVIGDDMAIRATDLRLSRDARCSLAFSLVVESLHALRTGRKPVVDNGRVQQMIRSLEDEVRVSCAEALTRFVSELSMPSAEEQKPQSREELFRLAVQPFLRDVWPQERSLSSPALSGTLARLPAMVHGCFVEAVHTIDRFLVPFSCWSMLDYGLHDDDNGTPKLAMIDDEAKAKALLRLLDATIATADNAVVPYDIGAALTQVKKISSSLARDPQYRRLETALRRINK